MSRLVYVLNGPNLNMLGKREPHIYGTTTLAQIRERVEALAADLRLECEFRQTNHEGTMVDWIQEAYERNAAVIINPAGLSFGSIPVVDALKLISKPIVEVHISNIHTREEFRHHSVISPVARGIIVGFGVPGYSLAIRGLFELHEAEVTKNLKPGVRT